MAWSRAGIYSAYYRALLKVDPKQPDKDTIMGSNKILVIAQSGIGNLILTLPLIETLSRRLDGSKVDVIVSPRGGSAILENLEYINEVMVYDDPKFLGRKERSVLFKRVKERGYDLVVTSFACNSIESALISMHARAKVRVGHRSSARVRPDKLYNVVAQAKRGRHEVQLNLDLARALGLKPVTELPRMKVSKKEVDWAHGFLQDEGVGEEDFVVGFHPGAHKDMPFKRWKRFVDLGKLLVKEMNAKVLVMGGPEERELCDSIVFDMGEGGISTAGRTKLRETAALIQCCEVFVSNDSGLMHLSVSVGTPVAALFGPTDYERTAPAGKHEMLRYDTGCGPCYVNPGDEIGCREIDCLHKITPEEVLSALMKLTG